MKKILALFGLIILSFNVFADKCIYTWTFQEGLKDIFIIKQCVRSSGSGGYYEIKNLTGDTAKACWKITFNNGKSSSLCRTMDGYEEGSASCYDCAPKNSGVHDMELTEFSRKLLK